MEHTATYSPDDNKLRLYPAYRLDKADYNRIRAAGFKWAPKQELFVAPMWTPDREDILIEYCGEIGDEDTSLVDRAEERAERFGGYSEKRLADAQSAKKSVDAIADGIPFGQPILVGHHSEKHARRNAKRIENGMRKAVKMWETSKYWEMRAAGAIKHAKYKELPNVRARRIKKIEADIRRCKAAYIPNPPDQTPIMQEDWNTREDKPHVWCSPRGGRGGRWVPVENLPALEKHYSRWIAHHEKRLIYEKAMLQEQGASELLKPKKRPKQPPLLNYRAPDGIKITTKWSREVVTMKQVEMTKAEYKAIPSDYKGGITSADGSHRVRETCRVNGKYQRVVVYLTDSKEHKRPEPTEKSTPPAPDYDRLSLGTVKYTPPEQTEFDQMKKSLREGIKTVSAPQLFPTPPDLAKKMVEAASVNAYDRVLEPSAGTGNILKAIGDQPEKIAVEINQGLISELMGLGLSGLHVRNADFLDCNGDLGNFDKIIMNPPFKNGEDIKHISHAVKFLRRGGRLVALCANGPRQREKLMPLVEQSGGYWEDLPEGSFKMAGTMVNTAMIVIEG